jgi:transposase-like protein
MLNLERILNQDRLTRAITGLNRKVFENLLPLYPLLRTTNTLKRLFQKFRAKIDEISAFPNEDSCLPFFHGHTA